MAQNLNVPEHVPRMGNAFSRGVGRYLLRVFGWTLEGEIPNKKHLMIAVAPHTSNWDFIIGMCTLLSLGLKVSYMMKREAFIWPLSGLYRFLGGIPIDRDRATDVVEQAREAYGDSDALWMGLTPEGTRSKVPRWKSGFLRIAYAAQVPVQLIAIDGKNKRIVLDQMIEASSQFEQQSEEIRLYMNAKYQGIKPNNQ